MPAKKNNITPEEAVEFLDSLRRMQDERDEPTVAISLRVPENILRALKFKAKNENNKYQTLIIDAVRKSLR